MKSWLSGALLAGLAIGAHAQEVKPGLWEDKTSYTVNGKPLVLPDERGRQISTIVSKGCLASKDAGDVRTLMERNMLKDMPGCKLSRWDYAGGTLKVTVSCSDSARGGAGTLEGSGPLSADRYDISGTGRSQHPQLGPMNIGFRYQGRYMGACKS
ncbi:hypothetical protein PI87_08525 [Ralstonia sp. A12]|uniref:DUF3617 domain-containing protein n=1 Tax=Ralstonia sp. A12 TaxID=1217052 RepID=UPI0005745915|nr:DUF3617 family protein [Ralstonia sp. A12]KHK57262.1 hypothetical protein PI87_08525 [Ralstonia sp. A12]